MNNSILRGRFFGGGAEDMSIDGRSLIHGSDPIPEPSTYALLGIGAIGMLMVMLRKKTG